MSRWAALGAVLMLGAPEEAAAQSSPLAAPGSPQGRVVKPKQKGPSRVRPAFPGMGGKGGIGDVPGAQALELGETHVSVEVSAERRGVEKPTWSPTPLNVGFGVGKGLELDLALRAGGVPGDPVPSPLIVRPSAKWSLFAPKEARPGVALGVVVDRANLSPELQLRAMTSLTLWRLQLAGFVGGSAEPARGWKPEWVAGAAGAFKVVGPLEALGEWQWGPRGAWGSAGLRVAVVDRIGVGLTGTWLPSEDVIRIGLGVGILADVTPSASSLSTVEASNLDASDEGEGRASFPLRVPEKRLPGEQVRPVGLMGTMPLRPLERPEAPVPEKPSEGGK